MFKIIFILILTTLTIKYMPIEMYYVREEFINSYVGANIAFISFLLIFTTIRYFIRKKKLKEVQNI